MTYGEYMCGVANNERNMIFINAGWGLGIGIIESVGHELGKAVSGLINLFNPELIVVGGTLSATREYLTLLLKSAVYKYSLTLVSKDTAIKVSSLGDRAGVVGACMLVRSKTLGLL